MTRLLESLMALLTIPVMVMNFAGIIVGGGWLLFLGQWKVLLLCLGLTFLGNYALMVPILLGLVFAIPGEMAEKRGWNGVLKVLALLSGLYTVCLMALWAFGSLAALVKLSSGHALLPFLLCSYAVATAPWQDMAQKEAPGPGGFNPSLTLAGFLSMSYVVAMVATLLGLPLLVSFFIIGGTLFIGLALNLKVASDIQKAQQQFGIY